jgi:adenosylhomocysteine nucleosidase
VGKVRAATTAALLVAHFPIGGIIFTGVAGALADHLQMGDVVLAHAAIEHDFGTGRPEGFVLGIDFIPELRHPLAEADRALYDLIVPQLERIPLHPLQGRQPAIHQGLVATGDVFVADANLRRQIRERTGALVASALKDLYNSGKKRTFAPERPVASSRAHLHYPTSPQASLPVELTRVAPCS